MPGPLMTNTSTQGLLGFLRSGRRTTVQAAAMRALVVDTAVETSPSPTRRARGSATIEYAYRVSMAAEAALPRVLTSLVCVFASTSAIVLREISSGGQYTYVRGE